MLISQVEVCSKLLISQSKFSDCGKFTLRYQQFEITGFDMYIKAVTVSELYSLVLEGTLRYLSLRYLELTV